MNKEMPDRASDAPAALRPTRYWRIRMKHERNDLTKEAWQQGIAGIWYGAWNTEQFEKTLDLSKNEASKILSKINEEAGLKWPVRAGDVDTARRFWGITKSDWAFTYFDDSIHLARVGSNVERTVHPTLGRGGELFKYRLLDSKKSFALSELPDCFRLLSWAGRSNVHEVPGTLLLIKLLADSESVSDVREKYRALSWEDWLRTLGPHGWEVLCLGYLILEEDFLPTGLDVGGTLPLFDLVGKNRSGQRIYAQCKKNPKSMAINDDLAKACASLVGDDCTVYLFAYSGCDNLPLNTKLIKGTDLQEWFRNNENGTTYMKLLWR